MKTALIITTYNSPKTLTLCLKSALAQTVLPDEIIVADDGSGNETKELINKFIQENKDQVIIHSYQEDRGFRAAASRNKAAFMSSCEYLIYVDGDMILHEHFVKDHIKNARKGLYLQGSRVLLKEGLTRDILKKMTFQKPSVLSRNIKNNLNAVYSPFLGRIAAFFSKNIQKGTRSCNFSFFKKDMENVNGFNEDFVTWGREDSEFITRMYHTGIKRKNLKFSAIQYHLYHKEGVSNSINDALLFETIKEKRTWCPNGIDKYRSK